MFGTLRCPEGSRRQSSSRRSLSFVETGPFLGASFVACERCRSRKVRCSGQRSGCDQCKASSEPCSYRQHQAAARQQRKSPAGADSSTPESIPTPLEAEKDDEAGEGLEHEGGMVEQDQQCCLELLLGLLNQLQTTCETEWTAHGLLAAHREGVPCCQVALQCARCAGQGDMVLIMALVCEKLARILSRAVWTPPVLAPVWLGPYQVASPQELQAVETAMMSVQLQGLCGLIRGVRATAPWGAAAALLAASEAKTETIALDLALRQ
ncbi:putative transcriptional regulatory protein [Lasiodiplodia theobromae]|uniref:Putative transcriptional regulatory protein n=1 Tax=Lasiodiplodia theobromae TaxID=45133 RepID=A0A5N5D0J7_9PEZI|nr:putative transcriptional regulatory protein [Lasiodiplodia theobromae]